MPPRAAGLERRRTTLRAPSSPVAHISCCCARSPLFPCRPAVGHLRRLQGVCGPAHHRQRAAARARRPEVKRLCPARRARQRLRRSHASAPRRAPRSMRPRWFGDARTYGERRCSAPRACPVASSTARLRPGGAHCSAPCSAAPSPAPSANPQPSLPAFPAALCPVCLCCLPVHDCTAPNTPLPLTLLHRRPKPAPLPLPGLSALMAGRGMSPPPTHPPHPPPPPTHTPPPHTVNEHACAHHRACARQTYILWGSSRKTAREAREGVGPRQQAS